MDYLKLASNQDEFSNLLDSIRVEKMPHWGSFEYHVSIAGKDPNGDQRLFRFNVRQLFCESFCNVDGLDYLSFSISYTYNSCFSTFGLAGRPRFRETGLALET